jgi:hypothetical protein
MATQSIVVAYCDITGETENVETVLFGLDGVLYEIDLVGKLADKLRDGLGEFIPNARRVTAKRGAGRKAMADPELNKRIREWAPGAGWEVSERGRIKSEIIDAYHANRSNPDAVQPEPVKAKSTRAKAEPPAAAFSNPETPDETPKKRTRAKAE